MVTHLLSDLTCSKVNSGLLLERVNLCKISLLPSCHYNERRVWGARVEQVVRPKSMFTLDPPFTRYSLPHDVSWYPHELVVIKTVDFKIER